MSITFTCKDSLIAKYCEETFGEQFRAALARQQTRGGREAWQRYVARELAKEAARQEWYDYEFELVGEPTDPAATGVSSVQKRRRKVILNEDLTPKLLIPEVTVDAA